MRLILRFECRGLRPHAFNVCRGAERLLLCPQCHVECVQLFRFGFEFAREIKNIAHALIHDGKTLGVKLHAGQVSIEVGNSLADGNAGGIKGFVNRPKPGIMPQELRHFL